MIISIVSPLNQLRGTAGLVLIFNTVEKEDCPCCLFCISQLKGMGSSDTVAGSAALLHTVVLKIWIVSELWPLSCQNASSAEYPKKAVIPLSRDWSNTVDTHCMLA